MNDITWPWLAGFFQAEGHASVRLQRGINWTNVTDKSYPKRTVTIYQDDIDVLKRIQIFLAANKVSSALGNKRINISTKSSSRRILTENLLGYVKYQKCQDIISALNEGFIEFQEYPLNWDFITGFWEGDGSINRGRIVFTQKDPSILEEIKSFIGSGNLYRYNISFLYVLDNDVVKLLLERCRINRRKMQLQTILIPD